MVSNPNIGNVHRGMRKLDSVIVEDLYLNETASIAPKDIQSEIIFSPACSYLEREGTMTNSMAHERSRTARRLQAERSAD